MSNFKQKILFVGNLPVTFKVFFEDLINLLNKNFQIDILTNKEFLNNKNQIKKVRYNHIPIQRNISFVKDFFCLIKMILFMKANKYDLIISVTPKSGLLSSIASFLTYNNNKIHIFTGQVWSNKNKVFKNFLILFDKLICLFSHSLLCDSKSQRDYLYQNKLTKKKIDVIGNGSICGVDLKKFNNVKNKDKIRKKLNLSKNDLILIYVGRINFDKGIHVLLKSFKAISKKYNNLTLLIVGEDEININKLINLNYLGIKKKIKIFPFSNKVDQYLKASNLFIFPSYREGFGVSVIEALACGLPVIVSDTYGLKDSFNNNVNGLKFKTGSYKSLSSNLVKLIENKKLRKKFSINARKFVETKFEKNKVINSYKKYLLSLVC